jgi:hypothetical protein
VCAGTAQNDAERPCPERARTGDMRYPAWGAFWGIGAACCVCGRYRKKQITRIQTAHNRNPMKPRTPIPALSVVTLTPATSHTSVRTAPAHPSQVGNTRRGAQRASRADQRRRGEGDHAGEVAREQVRRHRYGEAALMAPDGR